MNFFAYKAPNANFGDDLNEWLWPKVFPQRGGLWVRDGTFVGIGSILDERLEEVAGRKIVFGAGVRSQKPLKLTMANYDFSFVRGPISAMTIGGDVPYITDPAILISDYVKRIDTAQDIVGFMPHYHSLHLADWRKLCSEVGLIFLSPCDPCDVTLDSLKRCSRIICEAMHGAIVADALGIPWARITISAWHREGIGVSMLKWLDWGLSCGVDVEPMEISAMPKFGTDVTDKASRWVYLQTSQRRLYRAVDRLLQKLHFRHSTRAKHQELLASCHREIAALNS